jgi:hypothetical protein
MATSGDLRLMRWTAKSVALCCLTFELTPTAEAGGVSPVTDDDTNGGRRAYDACRSGSG